MKYGIKIKTPANNYVWYNWFSEAAGDRLKPYEFESHDLAEDYAQKHELPSFIIEPIKSE